MVSNLPAKWRETKKTCSFIRYSIPGCGLIPLPSLMICTRQTWPDRELKGYQSSYSPPVVVVSQCVTTKLQTGHESQVEGEIYLEWSEVQVPQYDSQQVEGLQSVMIIHKPPSCCSGKNIKLTLVYAAIGILLVYNIQSLSLEKSGKIRISCKSNK